MKRYSQQQISDLLDKFMDGLTSLEEEAALGDYFRTHEVPQVGGLPPDVRLLRPRHGG